MTGRDNDTQPHLCKFVTTEQPLCSALWEELIVLFRDPWVSKLAVYRGPTGQ